MKALLPRFAPHEMLAAHLLPLCCDDAEDGAHDLSHILRVWQNVRRIMAVEGGDAEILTAATLLHDCVNMAKDSPQRAQASRLAGARAAEILETQDWAAKRIAQTVHAIEAHSFSAQIPPETTEARILQDADRLDAIGHIGIARCFYIAGRMGSRVHDASDPSAEHRALDDTRYAVDHFKTKLLHLSAGFQTQTGAQLAQERHAVTQDFLDGILAEVSPD
jgi:uncharacterized protein